MKILFFINDLRSGGKERRLVELIKGLSKDSSYKMELVLTRSIIHYKEILSTNIKIHYTKRKEGVKKDPKVFYEFYKIAKRFHPDVIHVWGNLLAIYAIPAKVLLRIPMINNQITDAPKNVSKSILSHRLSFPFSDKIIANTYAGLKAYDAPKNKSTVIYNGFDYQRINNLENNSIIRKRFGIKTKFVVAMVATFSDKKDYSTYIRGANEVLKEFREITFLCIGDGDFSKYKEMVPKENTQNILFLGRQEHVESIMNICNIGVLMSDIIHGEGISNALMEFMSLEKPVIASNNGGNIELIQNGKNGFIIENNPKILKDKIMFLLNDDEKRKRFGNISKRIVNQKFSINTMIESFKREYNLVIK